jgi:biopolymer transport protein ExbD
MKRMPSLKYFIIPLTLLSAVSTWAQQQQPTFHDPLTDPLLIKESSVVVTINTDNDFSIGRKKIRRSGIAQVVKGRLKHRSPEEQVAYIMAAESVSYGTVVSVLGAIRATGITRIGLVADLRPNGKGCRKPAEERSEVKGLAESTQAIQRLTSALLQATEIIVRVNPVVEGAPKVELNSTSLSLAELTATLKALLEKSKDRVVIITARGNMPYCDIKRVIDVASAAGAITTELKAER